MWFCHDLAIEWPGWSFVVVSCLCLLDNVSSTVALYGSGTSHGTGVGEVLHCLGDGVDLGPGPDDGGCDARHRHETHVSHGACDVLRLHVVLEVGRYHRPNHLAWDSLNLGSHAFLSSGLFLGLNGSSDCQLGRELSLSLSDELLALNGLCTGLSDELSIKDSAHSWDDLSGRHSCFIGE